MKLKRTDYLSTGIFGELLNNDGSEFCLTLEHSYPVQMDGVLSSTLYQPKIPAGVYVCKRSMHLLEGAINPIETFEITGVPNHSGLLFHPGNTNSDSSGCILLGLLRQGDFDILESKKAFDAFMLALTGIDSFDLTIE